MSTLLIFAALVTVASSVGAQCPCFQHPDNANAYVCDDPSVTEVPDCVPLDITLFIISSPIPLIPQTISRFTMLDALHIAYRDVEISVDFFLYNTNIHHLSVYGTNMEFIDKNLFRNTPNLQGLNIEGNKFTSIPVDTFSLLPNIGYLFLDGNQLSTLSVDHFQANSMLTDIKLDNNPWQCDCQLATFIEWTIGRQITIGDDAYCKYPAELEGINLKNLRTENVC